MNRKSKAVAVVLVVTASFCTLASYARHSDEVQSSPLSVLAQAHDVNAAGASGSPPAVPSTQLQHVLEEQQAAHDRVLIDRFLLGISIIFAIISVLLFRSLPPRQQEQEG